MPVPKGPSPGGGSSSNVPLAGPTVHTVRETDIAKRPASRTPVQQQSHKRRRDNRRERLKSTKNVLCTSDAQGQQQAQDLQNENAATNVGWHRHRQPVGSAAGSSNDQLLAFSVGALAFGATSNTHITNWTSVERPAESVSSSPGVSPDESFQGACFRTEGEDALNAVWLEGWPYVMSDAFKPLSRPEASTLSEGGCSSTG